MLVSVGDGIWLQFLLSLHVTWERVGGIFLLVSGKNLTNFMFLYLVGNQLYYYKDRWMNIPTSKLLLCYIVFNVVIISLEFFTHGNIVGKMVMSLSFPYSSPLILVGAAMFFMIIGKQHISSSFINYVAGSSLAIYLIHCCRPYLPELHSVVCGYFQSVTDNNIYLLMLYAAYTLIVIAACVCIDKCFTPLWSLVDKIGKRINNVFII